MAPTVSIITPSFNQGRFLEDCITSVIGQGGDFCIDYIIIDGGSADNSLSIIRKYEALLAEGKWQTRCKGITYRWISEKDEGQADALNKGFQLAEGEIVAWLNSDDYYTEGAFAEVVRVFQGDDSLSVLFGDGSIVDKEGKGKRHYDVEPLFDLWKLIHLYDFISQPSAFMHRQALKNAGFLDKKLHYIMDWELWIRLSRFGRIRHLSRELSCARVYPETKTKSAGLRRWREIKSCSRRYGHLKWPPVVLTQFFHRPLQLFLETRQGGQRNCMVSLAGYLKKIHYALIGGNRSGIYADGCVERTGFLSLPLRREVAKVLIGILPLCANTTRYFINNRYSGVLRADDNAVNLEIMLTDEMRGLDYLHLKFISEKSVEVGPLPLDSVKRKGSFVVRDISLQQEDGREVRDIGLPEFHRGRSAPAL